MKEDKQTAIRLILQSEVLQFAINPSPGTQRNEIQTIAVNVFF